MISFLESLKVVLEIDWLRVRVNPWPYTYILLTIREGRAARILAPGLDITNQPHAWDTVPMPISLS